MKKAMALAIAFGIAALYTPMLMAAPRASGRQIARASAKKKKPAPVVQAPAEPAPAPESKPDEAAAVPPSPAEPTPVTNGAKTQEVGKEKPALPAPSPTSLGSDEVQPGDVRRLRARYDELRDEVFRSRARRETLEQALFSTKLTANLRWEANRRYTLNRAEVRVDGARIWDSGDKPVGEDRIELAPRSVAPGPHILLVRVEVHPRDNPKLGYSSEQTFTVSLPEGKETKVSVVVDEDGRLPSYNPDIAIKVD